MTHKLFIFRKTLRIVLVVIAVCTGVTLIGMAFSSDEHHTGDTFYIDPNGWDLSAGSAVAPMRTIQRAVDVAGPGDTIIVRRGTYSGFVIGWGGGRNGTKDAPITIRAEAGAAINARNSKTADAINIEGASYVIIDGFQITNPAGTIARAGIRSVQNEHVTIRNNTIDGMGTWGIFTSHSDYVTIDHNTTSHSKAEHGIYVSNSGDHPVIRNNTVFGNRDNGIHMNGDVGEGGDGVISYALVENNIIYDNGVAGGSAINCDGVQDSIFQNNLLYDNHSSGISLFRANGAEPSVRNVIVNNTIVMAADSTRWAVNIKNGSTNNSLYNNILLHKGGRGAINVAPDSATGLVSDYNVVTDRLSPDDGSSILRLSQWRSRTKRDAHSLVASADHLFVNAAGGDYRLAASSPAINAGIKLPAPLLSPGNDIEGNERPQDGKYDIGAYRASHPAAPMAQSSIAQSIAASEPASLAPYIAGGILGLVMLLSGGGWIGLRKKGMNRWLWSYLKSARSRHSIRPGELVHVLICIADHYEPNTGKASDERAAARVQAWVQRYPELFGRFRDSDGRPPRHTFFYPIEQYNPAHVEAIAGLCRQGFGEVEVHLHHDNDTAENLRKTLDHSIHTLASRHGLLSRHHTSGQLGYAFVHGNWALDNSLPSGRWCGVNNELDVLRETGCFVDMTLPAAPSQAQTSTINSIYYASDDPCCSKSHNHGVPVGQKPRPADSLMLIQGPLVLNWRNRKFGIIPRIENACLQGNQAPSASRLDDWLRARVQVPGRPDWFFVKLHTHGAPEANQRVLLGDPMVRFHQQLAARAARDANFHFHYVTAREMYNLARAAEADWTGSVEAARDFEMRWNGAAGTARTDRAAEVHVVGPVS